MRKVLILGLALAGCQQPPPCEDAACMQARSNMMQHMINNQQQNNMLQQQNMWRVVQPPVYNSPGFACSRIGGMTYCR
jgi:outer membrane PBP1 activator LpoA protein